jgi:hypothetical protein
MQVGDTIEDGLIVVWDEWELGDTGCFCRGCSLQEM